MIAFRVAKLFLFCIAIIWSLVAYAEVPIPPLTARVIDLTNTLTLEQKSSLEKSLAVFEQKNGAQVAILMIPSTKPEAIEQYSLRVVEQWKLGRKKVDDGVLLIIAKDDRSLRIEVGYGLEGELNDAVSKRIISDIIVPFFKKGDYYYGIAAGISAIMNVISGQPLTAVTERMVNKDQAGLHSGTGYTNQGASSATKENNIYMFLYLFAVAFFRPLFGSKNKKSILGFFVAGLMILLSWILFKDIFVTFLCAMLVLTAFLGGNTRGGGGISGGGSGGGSSGGGFSGGGGSFGGGGSSGKW